MVESTVVCGHGGPDVLFCRYNGRSVDHRRVLRVGGVHSRFSCRNKHTVNSHRVLSVHSTRCKKRVLCVGGDTRRPV